MKSYNRKKRITIAVLAVVAVLLAGGLWFYLDSMGNSEPAAVIDDNTTQEPDGSGAPDIEIPLSSGQDTQSGETEGAGAGTTSDSGSIPSVSGNQSKPSDGKPKTPAEATPPSTPETDHEPSGSGANTPSSSTPAQPESSVPQSGDTQDGKIYIPGFGWIEDEGGGADVDDTSNGAHNGNKVGDM